MAGTAGKSAPDGIAADRAVSECLNPDGAGDVVLVCEHACNFIPAEFAGLGLAEALRDSHIAWDPGALGVAAEMSARLDAPLHAARISRLVYDCNRPPVSPGAVPERSEIFDIPGNRNLSAADLRQRAERFYEPFRAGLVALLDERGSRPAAPVLATVHTFTPVYNGVARSVEIGIVHDDDARLADAVLARAGGGELDVRRNEPYGPADGVTHTLRDHALPRGLLNVMIEVRNDLVADAASQRRIGAVLAGWLSGALADLGAAAARRR